MAAVTICSDFGAQENKVSHCFHCFPCLFAMKWWDEIPWSLFFEYWVFSELFHCLSLLSRGSLVPPGFLPYGWHRVHIWYYCYFSQLSWFQLVLHPWLLLARILEWLAFPSPEDLPNPGLPHCRRILYQLSHHRSPKAVSVQFSPVARLCLTLCEQTRIGRASTKNSAFLIWAVVIYLN